MRDIYVCVIFLRVKIYWMFFYQSHFFDVHFSYCEVFMCQVLGGLLKTIVKQAKKLQTLSLSFPLDFCLIFIKPKIAGCHSFPYQKIFNSINIKLYNIGTTLCFLHADAVTAREAHLADVRFCAAREAAARQEEELGAVKEMVAKPHNSQQQVGKERSQMICMQF